MPGVPDPLYVLARRALLDVLDALGPQRHAVILVGAQAIYLHTGEADLAVAPYTTDADVAVDPRLLSPEPLLGEALQAGGLTPTGEMGRWRIFVLEQSVLIDLLVPEALAGEKGRRAARLGAHGNRIARRARGLEAALVDNAPQDIKALEPGDPRRYTIRVAGPGALLVAKLHKIADRSDQVTRLTDKDALDVLRLLRSIPTQMLGERLRWLRQDPVAATVTDEAVTHLRRHFAQENAPGAQMAARAVEPLEDPVTIAISCEVLTRDLLKELGS